MREAKSRRCNGITFDGCGVCGGDLGGVGRARNREEENDRRKETSVEEKYDIRGGSFGLRPHTILAAD